jgi:transposase InsO family protein
MPFKECSIMERRSEFCRLASMPGANIRQLCRRAGISPPTAYKWLARYEQLGEAGLVDRPRRPLSSPGRTRSEVEALVLAVRRAHPAWGGRKIRRVLEMDGLADPPSASTVTAILRRHDLLDGPRAGEARDYVRFEHAEPNDLWQMDFKGHVGMAEGRCHPLTVLDDHSRYALEIGACGDARTATVRDRLTATFRLHGLPKRILADNGAPWGSAGSPSVHTVLTIWLLDLGVGVIHGRPYHPQTQGKDERFHRTLKAEVLDGRTFLDLDQAQDAFDRWRPIYNSRRPHEALDMDTPASRYRPSSRSMPNIIAPPEYEPGAEVRSVHEGGWVSFKGRRVPCPHAVCGRRIVLRPTQTDGVYDLCYRSHVLAAVDLRQSTPQPVNHVPEQVSAMSPV